MSDGAGVRSDGGHRLDRVRLTGISATGYHGVFDHERREGQTFVVDVVAHLDTRRAAATDDLAHTLDYGALAEEVVAVLVGEPADLIETVAERVAATVLAHPQVQAVDVAVHKPQAPITVPFDDVVVEVRRDRSWLPAAEPLRSAPAEARPWHPVSGGSVPVAGAGTAAAGVAGGVVGAAAVGAAAAGAVAGALPPSPPTAPLPTVAPFGGGAPVVEPAPAGPVTPVEPASVPVGTLPALPPAPAPAAAVAASGPETSGGPGAPDALDVLDADEVVEAELVQDALDVPPAEPVEVVLAIGSNLGAAQDTLRDAVADLAAVAGLEVTDVSALARTAPVGGPDQPDFLNAVLIARTTLSPRDLLRATAGVEQAHGRERTVHWGPRTLDVDIIVYGGVSAVTDDLELPHPRAHERAFVLQPWAQVQPDAVLHGLGGGPVAALAATAPDRDGVRWLALDWLTAPAPTAPHEHEHAAEQATERGYGSGQAHDGSALPVDGPADVPAAGPATTAWLPDPDELPALPVPVVAVPVPDPVASTAPGAPAAPAPAPAPGPSAPAGPGEGGSGSTPRTPVWPDLQPPRQDP